MDATITGCDYTVKIPMSHEVDSLNVAAASAVAFWELGKKVRECFLTFFQAMFKASSKTPAFFTRHSFPKVGFHNQKISLYLSYNPLYSLFHLRHCFITIFI